MKRSPKPYASARPFIISGTGTGASSAMEQLLLDLKKNHPRDSELRCRVDRQGTEHHLTEAQLLAKARELFVAA